MGKRDRHRADRPPLAPGGHGRQVALAVGALDALQPVRVGRKGPVDHEQPHQMAGPIVLHNQAVAGKDIVCAGMVQAEDCLLYTSDAADERSSVDLGGRRIIKKKKTLSRVVRRLNALLISYRGGSTEHIDRTI